VGKPQLVLHSCENKLLPLGKPFPTALPCSYFETEVGVHLNYSLHLKVALLNLITISSTWARVIDVMDSEVSFGNRI
jgi:hypothetical protein